MAVDFEISSLSGTGTATIRVKPKAVNTEQTPKEQVLKVIVQGVEREVTLVHKGKPPVVETWSTYFTLTPDTTSHNFDGTKRGESLEIGVYSYQQKLLDGTPQEEYRAVDWEATSTVDWLTPTKVVGETNQQGKLTIKTNSTNLEHSGNDADPIERVGIITLTQTGTSNSKEIKITQGKGKVTFKLETTGNGSQISNSALDMSGSKDVTLIIKGVSKRINDVEVKLYQNQMVKIPTLGQRITYEGNIPIPGTGNTQKSRGDGWVNKPGGITSNWYGQITLNCNFQHDRSTTRVDAITAAMYGVFPKWPWQIDPSRLPPGCTLSNLDYEDSFYFLP